MNDMKATSYSWCKMMPASVLIIGSGAVGAVYAQAPGMQGARLRFWFAIGKALNAAIPRTLAAFSVLPSPKNKRLSIKTSLNVT